MGWIYVLIAAIAELTGVVGLNKFNEKKTIPHTLMFFGGFAAPFVFLNASFNY